MKEKYKQAHMRVAEVYAGLSSAVRLHVGAIVVKDNRVISIGYNGMPAGWDNTCEDKIYPNALLGDYELHYDEFDAAFPYKEQLLPKESNKWQSYNLKTKREVLHAETNAIAKLARSNESGFGATMFVTHAPCLDCAKLIYQTGINTVYYRNQYRETAGIDFLKKSEIKVEQI